MAGGRRSGERAGRGHEGRYNDTQLPEGRESVSLPQARTRQTQRTRRWTQQRSFPFFVVLTRCSCGTHPCATSGQSSPPKEVTGAHHASPRRASFSPRWVDIPPRTHDIVRWGSSPPPILPPASWARGESSPYYSQPSRLRRTYGGSADPKVLVQLDNGRSGWRRDDDGEGGHGGEVDGEVDGEGLGKVLYRPAEWRGWRRRWGLWLGVHPLLAERDGLSAPRPPIALGARVPRVERPDELLDLGGHAALRMNVEYGGQKLVLLLVRGAPHRCCDVAIWLVVLGFGVTDSGNTNRVVRKAWRRCCRSGGPRRRW